MEKSWVGMDKANVPLIWNLEISSDSLSLLGKPSLNADSNGVVDGESDERDSIFGFLLEGLLEREESIGVVHCLVRIRNED